MSKPLENKNGTSTDDPHFSQITVISRPLSPTTREVPPQGHSSGKEDEQSKNEIAVTIDALIKQEADNANLMNNKLQANNGTTADSEDSDSLIISSPAPGSSKGVVTHRILPLSRKSSQVVPSLSESKLDTIIPIEKVASVEMTPVTTPTTPPPQKSTPSILNKRKVGNNAINWNPLGWDPRDDSSGTPGEEVCRICHDNPSRMTLLSPCLCKGSMGKVHRECLERWLGESAKTCCEICGHEYETERRPKFVGWRSFIAWIRHPLNPTDTRNLFFDLACFFILTPLAGISAWLCVVGAQHYSFGPSTLNPDKNPDTSPFRENMKRSPSSTKLNNRTVEATNSTWTSIGLLTLTGTLLAAYYVWLFVAVRYHIQVWREWQARNFVVTISPQNSEAVRKVRELREAAAAELLLEPREEMNQQQINRNHAETSTPTPEQAFPPTPRGPGPHLNNNSPSGSGSSNNGSNNNGNNSQGKTNNNDMNNKRLEQEKLREKTLARAFEETASMESDGTISDIPSTNDGAGPSRYYSNRDRSNKDTDSIQGKVIFAIPSTSEPDGDLNNGTTTAGTSARRVEVENSRIGKETEL